MPIGDNQQSRSTARGPLNTEQYRFARIAARLRLLPEPAWDDRGPSSSSSRVSTEFSRSRRGGRMTSRIPWPVAEGRCEIDDSDPPLVSCHHLKQTPTAG